MAALTAIEGKSGNLVPHLVANRMGDPRQIAIAAAHEFGVPLLDLDAVDLDFDVVKLVDEKLLLKHRILPILQRGKRLFLAVCDPTNLQALDEIKFQTTLRIEAIVVEQDKLDIRVARAIEAVDTTMSNLGDEEGFDLENLEVTGGDEEAAGADVANSDIDDAPIVRFVNKVMVDAIKKGASDIHFEPYEKHFRIRLRQDGVLTEIARPPVGAGDEGLRPLEGHGSARHRRAAHSARRPHQDEAVEESRHRLPRQHVPDVVRRESRLPVARSLERSARHRRTRIRGRSEAASTSKRSRSPTA